MSYFAKASLTGVEKVAVAIVLRRRQLSALQGGVREMPSRAAQPFASTRQVSACKGCKGEMCPRLPAQRFAAAAGPVARSSPQQRSQRRETQASGQAAIIGTKRDYLAACKPLGIGKNMALRGLYSKHECKTHGAKPRKKTQESAHTQC